MKFIIKNRDTIEKINPKKPYLVISITTKEQNFAKPAINENYINVQYLKFDDDEPLTAATVGREHLVMQQKDAKKILDFIQLHMNNYKIQEIYCQCDGGISRSSAVAAALSVIINGPRSDQWIFNDIRYCPNMHVYRMILNEYNKRSYGELNE